uniref:Nose resistant-to-fluoxetine protein N-terminal domain-containing protein n=1 Tax=Tetranychus urticae TaxID=32264 RepID=T1KBF4_TETUR
MVKSMGNYILIWFFLVSIVPLNCEPDHLQSWKNFWSISDSAFRKLGNYFDNQLTPLIKSESISSSCQGSLLKFIDGIKNFDIDSVRMFDSWGKLPSGLLFGSWSDLGSFDQCVSLENSQYCLLTGSMPLPSKRQHEGLFIPLDKSSFNLTDPLSVHLYPYAHYFHNVNLTFGVCAPRECSPQEMTLIAKSLIHSYGLQMKVNVDLCQHRAKSGNQILFREYVALIIISTVIALNIFGTIYSTHPFLGHFNFPLNWSKLLSTTNNQPNRSYPFIECFKFFAMIYLILTHVGWAFNHNSFHSIFKIQSMYKGILGYSLLPSYMGSEVYFLMTGLELMTFFLSFKGKFTFSSAISFLLIRWARFVTLIGFYISLYILVFSDHVRDLVGGPFWSHLYSATSIPVI